MDTTEKLLKIKGLIEAAERQVAQIEGRLQSAHERLKKEFQIETVEEAQKELKRMDEDLTQMEIELAAGVEALEKAYPWGV